MWNLSQISSSSRKPTIVSHDGRKVSTNSSHVEGIDIVEKYKKIGHNPMFHYNISKGDHITHMFLIIPELQRVWFMSQGYSSSEKPIISQ